MCSTEPGAINHDMPKYQTLSATISSTPFTSILIISQRVVCAHSFLQKLNIDIRLPDLGTKEKNVRKTRLNSAFSPHLLSPLLLLFHAGRMYNRGDAKESLSLQFGMLRAGMGISRTVLNPSKLRIYFPKSGPRQAVKWWQGMYTQLANVWSTNSSEYESYPA